MPVDESVSPQRAIHSLQSGLGREMSGHEDGPTRGRDGHSIRGRSEENRTRKTMESDWAHEGGGRRRGS
jgi:hypothetical protein